MKKNRSTLKDYFKKGAIPTEANFADLIDSMLNQEEDNLSKLPNDPLKITAVGVDEALLNFYHIEKNEEKLSWQVKQNLSQKPGLNISDATSIVRFFIENGTGNVGLGTNAPKQGLDIRGRLNVENGVIQRGGDPITNVSDLGLYSRVDRNWIRLVTTNAPIRFYSDGGIGTNPDFSVQSGLVEVSKTSAGALGGTLRISNFAGGANAQAALDFATYDPAGNASSARILITDNGNYSGHIDFQTKTPGANANPLATRLRITGDGNVGIGTANPGTKLAVVGNIRFGAIPDGSTAPTWQLDTGSWQNANIMYDGGVDNVANSATFGFHGGGSRTVNLRVDGNSTVDGNASVGGALSFGARTRQMVNLWNTDYGIGIQNSTQYFRTGKNFVWYKGGAHSDGELDPGAGGVTQMAIKDGNVGIGTNDPGGYKLRVEGGTISTSGNLHTQRARVAFSNTADDTNHTIYNNGFNIDGEGAWDGMKMNVYAGLDVRVGDVPTKKQVSALRIDSGGNISIGSTAVYNPQGWNKTVDILGTSHARLNVRSSGGVVTSIFTHDDWAGPRGVIGTETKHPLTFATAYTHRMTIDADGNVGIGTSAPKAKFQVVGGAIMPEVGATETTGIFFPPDPGGGGSDRAWMRYYVRSGEATTLEIGTSNDADDHIALITAGNVGIGTNAPSKGKLEIVGGVAQNKAYEYEYLNFNQAGHWSGTANISYSIWTDQRMACPEFNAMSDVRIKNVLGRSNSAHDLAVLKQIEITDYDYKDKISNDRGMHKKVIGQQIVKVFPQAVNQRITDVIPDIMQKAHIENGIVHLANHTLNPKERVKLIFEDKTEIFDVESADQDSFKISAQRSGDVFVYGREVQDFHVVDYDAIAMLNVSATQEISRQVEALQSENAALQARVSLVEQENSLLRAEFKSLAGQITALPTAS